MSLLTIPYVRVVVVVLIIHKVIKINTAKRAADYFSTVQQCSDLALVLPEFNPEHIAGVFHLKQPQQINLENYTNWPNHNVCMKLIHSMLTVTSVVI